MDPEDKVPFHVLGWRALNKPGLQLPGRAIVLRDIQFGGDGDPTDRRLVLHQAQLEELLRVAKESMTKRVVLHGFGVRVQLMESRGKHRYEHCTLVGNKLEPEPAPIGGLVLPREGR